MRWKAQSPGWGGSAIGAADFSFRKHQDGGYIVTQRGKLDAPLTLDHLLLGRRYLKALKTQRDALPGPTLASGFSGHGFATSPAAQGFFHPSHLGRAYRQHFAKLPAERPKRSQAAPGQRAA